MRITFEFVGGPHDGKLLHGVVGEASDAERYYVSIAEQGLFRSEDAGATWEDVASGDLAEAITFSDPNVPSENNNTEMAVGQDGRIYAAVLRDGQPEDSITRSAATDYEPNAEAPRFAKFLAEVFDGDPELVNRRLLLDRRACTAGLHRLSRPPARTGPGLTLRHAEATLFRRGDHRVHLHHLHICDACDHDQGTSP